MTAHNRLSLGTRGPRAGAGPVVNPDVSADVLTKTMARGLRRTVKAEEKSEYSLKKYGRVHIVGDCSLFISQSAMYRHFRRTFENSVNFWCTNFQELEVHLYSI